MTLPQRCAMSKQTALLGAVLGLALGAGLASLSERWRVTRAKFERVEKGMSYSQVVQVVGRPPGDYTTGPCMTFPHGVRYWAYKSWLCDEGQLLARFDVDGTAAEVVVCDVMHSRPMTPVKRLRRWMSEFALSMCPAIPRARA
jgi:hypothetical protein